MITVNNEAKMGIRSGGRRAEKDLEM